MATGGGGTASATIAERLGHGADAAAAVLAPGRLSLTYRALREHVHRTVADLNTMGIGRNDRVAIVLPNGPEMAAAFVAVGAGTTAAPLNPAYRREEFSFYMADLGARLLVVEEDMDSPAIAAGTFTLHPEYTPGPVRSGGMAVPGNSALVLHTSGTTTRPKIVPLSHRNVTGSPADSFDS